MHIKESVEFVCRKNPETFKGVKYGVFFLPESHTSLQKCLF